MEGYPYILKNRKPQQASFLEYAKWFEDPNNRRIAKTHLSESVRVSTAFLGLDHQFQEGLPPILFETMIFGGKMDGHTWRYYTYDQSVKGHNAIVKMLHLLNRFKHAKSKNLGFYNVKPSYRSH